ncbi:Hypothetical predicted protein, partial [Marmota monax]
HCDHSTLSPSFLSFHSPLVYICYKFNIFNGGKKTNIIDSILRILEQYSSNLEDSKNVLETWKLKTRKRKCF